MTRLMCTKSETLRVTRVIRWCTAVAAIRESITFIEPKRKPKKESAEGSETIEEKKAPTEDETKDESIFKSAPINQDPVKEESLHILSDLIQLIGKR